MEADLWVSCCSLFHVTHHYYQLVTYLSSLIGHETTCLLQQLDLSRWGLLDLLYDPLLSYYEFLKLSTNYYFPVIIFLTNGFKSLLWVRPNSRYFFKHTSLLLIFVFLGPG